MQRAFDEERADYEKRIISLETQVSSVKERLEKTADKRDLQEMREERDKLANERDEAQLEKNKVGSPDTCYMPYARVRYSYAYVYGYKVLCCVLYWLVIICTCICVGKIHKANLSHFDRFATGG